jgi:hypothetical protein
MVLLYVARKKSVGLKPFLLCESGEKHSGNSRATEFFNEHLQLVNPHNECDEVKVV